MRRSSPFGNPVIWLLAVLVLPEVIKKCKPLAKTVGDALVGAGESFRKAAAEPDKPTAEIVEIEVEAVAEEAAPEEAAEPKKSSHKKSKTAEPPVQTPEPPAAEPSA